MKYILFSLLNLSVFTMVYGQLKPAFLPEEIIISDINNEYYGQSNLINKSRAKGLLLSYGFTRSNQYTLESNTITGNPTNELDRLSFVQFKLKIPILVKGRTKVLLGYKYFAEFYDFEIIRTDFAQTLQTLDKQSLKNTDYSVIISHTINESKYFHLRYKYAANGNFSSIFNFESKHSINSIMGIYGIRKSEDFEWGIGLVFSNSFRRNNLIPFMLYNRSFSDKWGIESLFPYNLFFRYNLNAKTIALFGVEYNSQSYRLAINDALQNTLDYAFNHSEVLCSVDIERHLTSWIWANLKLGYQFNFDNEFEAKSMNAANFQANQASGLFLNIGVFVSPE